MEWEVLDRVRVIWARLEVVSIWTDRGRGSTDRREVAAEVEAAVAVRPINRVGILCADFAVLKIVANSFILPIDRRASTITHIHMTKKSFIIFFPSLCF